MTHRSLKRRSNPNATADTAGAPLGFGDVMFSKAATPVVPFVAPVVDAQAEAFLA
jgi:hypothetical protein